MRFFNEKIIEPGGTDLGPCLTVFVPLPLTRGSASVRQSDRTGGWGGGDTANRLHPYRAWTFPVVPQTMRNRTERELLLRPHRTEHQSVESFPPRAGIHFLVIGPRGLFS